MTHNTEYKPSLRHAAERFKPGKESMTKEQMANTMSHNTECQPSLRHVGLSMWPWKYEKKRIDNATALITSDVVALGVLHLAQLACRCAGRLRDEFVR